ncbi:hypothetical protein H6P81_002342 [Aristolochia fimbriata]|uniref:Carbohydrate-binding-like fold protein n=1 Tax=Aristolochia fimbriata TaxID=158543 RepID=A0AAV7FB55_ARIFI|nr:hypothetical protein H6P81_002342 [Aristolochia fimbriata]
MSIGYVWLFLSIALSASSVAGDSIQGCGGFVEASSSLIKSRKPSDAKLDYSHITVELQTVDGLVKDRTQCAPNGYYFIPVYDKGPFVIKIKGPEGWSWNPDKVPVIIDENGCNSNEDINFRFTGFTISGRVMGAVGGESCSLKDGGPLDVKVELFSPTNDVIASTLTSSAGDYSFTNIIPGNYKLHASHPTIKVETRGSPEVELGFGNGVRNDVFFVPGYDIDGFVVAQGNPILGVHVYLYSDDVLNVNCPQGNGNSPWQRHALCHAVSDADGRFTFNSVPCGKYELLPYYKGENTVFDVSPPSINVSVDHHHVTVAQKFQVTGFSVGGRVVDGTDNGVEGVKIIVDGVERSITDAQGYYKLDQVTSKHYTIAAERDHYKFNSLENFMVLPNMASVEDIKAAFYDICGTVRSITSGYKAKVALTHGPENVKPQVKQTDQNGRFCFEVPPGEYRLSALPSTESSSVLLFLPPFIDVQVTNPVLNLEFSQAQVDIQGSVKCKNSCGPSVRISLTRLTGKHKEEIRTIALTQDSSDFTFSKVFPGEYLIEVKHESVTEEDDWCWEESSIHVNVGTEDKKGVLFVQKGYWVNIISTHDVDASVHQPDGATLRLAIKKGSQRMCIESSGKHELHFQNSCISFGSSSVKFDTLDPSPIYLKGDKYLLMGEIHITPIVEQDSRPLVENVIVDILNEKHEVLGTSHARLRSESKDQTGIAIYEYLMWANLGDSLTFVPQHSRNNEEKEILFYPRERQVIVQPDGCQHPIPAFVGRTGLYVEGSVSPPLSGVNIKIVATEESSNAPLKRGEVALETKTGENGYFIGGPLYDDTTYSVEASKPGYHLKPVGPNSFSCQKLSQISVHIYPVEEAKELFPSVLLSLSGEDGYRNNSVSHAGGHFMFDNLFPGSFYLRPLLKEYSFSPAAQAIELGSGESKEIVFHASRVAYSAMGAVTLLSGQPKESVSVEARSLTKGYYEETATDSSGNYRLRGLLPDTTYIIKVGAKYNSGSSRIERASPESVTVKVGSEDIKGLDFVVFEQPDMTMLSGHVEGVNLEELQPHLSVEVRSASDPSKIESVVPLPLSYFFQIKDLPKGKHIIQLKSGLSSSIQKFKSEVIEVDLEKQSQIHVGPLKFKVEEQHHKLELTPAPVFPLIVGISVIVLFIFMPRMKDLYQFTVGLTPLGSSTTSLKREVKKNIVRKRTY